MTQQEIVNSILSAKGQMQAAARLMDDMADTLEGRMAHCIDRRFNVGRMKDAVLCDCSANIGMMAQQLAFYFVNDRQLARLTEASFTADELDDGAWEAVENYKAGQIVPASLFCSLPERVRARIIIKVVIDLKLEDVVSLFLGDRFDIDLPTPHTMTIQFSPTHAMDINMC